MVADVPGNPVDFEITWGEVHDAKTAGCIIDIVGAVENFTADKGFDSESIRDSARQAGINPVIPRKSNSKKPNSEFDPHLCKLIAPLGRKLVR
jgi:hypothetical protein